MGNKDIIEERGAASRGYSIKGVKAVLAIICYADFKEVPSGRDKAYRRTEITYRGRHIRSENLEAIFAC